MVHPQMGTEFLWGSVNGNNLQPSLFKIPGIVCPYINKSFTWILLTGNPAVHSKLVLSPGHYYLLSLVLPNLLIIHFRIWEDLY